jgi:hypothetical protein
VSSRKLTIADIADTRAYERERDSFRRQVIALKRRRRVAIGPLVTMVFENRTTMRFQVQEMARAESMTTDAQIQVELDTYNLLVPERQEICATLFIELTSQEALRLWLPRLVGIESCVEIRLTGEQPSDRRVVKATADEAHASQLTREEVTASVHYVRLSLDDDEASAFAKGEAEMAIVHPEYAYSTRLSRATVASILADWGDGVPGKNIDRGSSSRA